MRVSFILLSVLNIVDGIFTFIGLKFGWITEANPLMHFMWTSSPFFFLLSKIILSISLLYLAFYFFTKNKQTWRIILAIPICLYSFVFVVHLFWISQMIT